jgi:hypothetical protein
MSAMMPYARSMSARDAIIAELKLAPESLVREAYDFVLFLKSRREQAADGLHAAAPERPDFLARQRALFGTRELPDSQEILDELRAERF